MTSYRANPYSQYRELARSKEYRVYDLLAAGSYTPKYIGENACLRACRRGDFDELRAARAGGCAWTGEECAVLARVGRFDMLRWAVASGSPHNASAVAQAARSRGYEDIARYVVNMEASRRLRVTV